MHLRSSKAYYHLWDLVSNIFTRTTATTIPPLLQIPLKIRQTIWKYCQPKKSDLTINCCLSASTPQDSPEDKLFRLRYDDLETVVPKNPHPLLYINRQISGEILALWKGGWIFWLCSLPCARELIERMTRRQMGLVGELHMYRPSYGNQGQYEWLVLETEAMTEAWRKSPDIGSDMVLVKADGIRWSSS